MPKRRAKIYVVGSCDREEDVFVIQRLHRVLTERAGDLATVFLTADADVFDGAPLTAAEAHYENTTSLEECDFVVAVPSPTILFEMGYAYALRKQIFTLSPRTTILDRGLNEAVMLHVTPSPLEISPQTPFRDSDGKVNFEWETGLDSALEKMTNIVRELAPLYVAPKSIEDTLMPVIDVLKAKWGN